LHRFPETVAGAVPFLASSYVDQLNLILNVLGTPDDDMLSKVSSEKASKEDNLISGV
jgi:hypothetical protein